VSAGRVWPGVALYYVVLGFNLAVTAWIREWALLALGGLLHAVIVVTIRLTRQTPGKVPGRSVRECSGYERPCLADVGGGELRDAAAPRRPHALSTGPYARAPLPLQPRVR